MDLRTMGYGFAAATLGQAAILELSRNGPPTYQMLAACRDSYYEELAPLFKEIAEFMQKPLEERLNYKVQGVTLSQFSWAVYDAAKVEFGKDLYFSVMPEKVIHDTLVMKKCKEFMDSDERYTSALSLTSTLAGGLVLAVILFPDCFSKAIDGFKFTQNRIQRLYAKCVSSRQVLMRKAKCVKKLSDSIFRNYLVKVTTAVKMRSNCLKESYKGLQNPYTSLKLSYTEYNDRLLSSSGMSVKIPLNPKVVRSQTVGFDEILSKPLSL